MYTCTSGRGSYGGFRFNIFFVSSVVDGAGDPPRNSTGYSGGVAVSSVGGALGVQCRSRTELTQCS